MSRRGAASIELALVLPVLLALMLGLVDWSWYMYVWLNVDVAANRGARIAAGVPDDPASRAVEAVCATLERLGTACTDANVRALQTSDGSGQVVEVTVELPFDAPVGLVRTPTVLRTTASTAWYGYLYEVDP